jgi:hypothetical protein
MAQKNRKLASFKMGAYAITVEGLSTEKSDELKVMGLCDAEHSKIHVLETLEGTQSEEILLHEMLHMASDLGGINLTERQVGSLSVLLHQGLATLKRFPRKGKKVI